MVNYESLETLTEDESALSAVMESNQTTDPFSGLNRKDTKALLDRLFNTLTEEERTVLSCYYYRGLNLREIGSILSLGESRICQIHTRALLKLRTQLQSQVPSAKNLILMLLES